MSKTVQAVAVAVLLTAAFWAILSSLYGSWFDAFSYMEHGILVFPAAAYMVWTKRAKLVQISPKPSMWSLPLLVWGAGQASLGTAAHWVWISRTALLVSLVGCIAALYGWEMVRELAYPLGTLILMIAPPTFLYERLTLDLQLLASRIGEGCLEALGYSVMREGNILELVGTKLSVAEACSGIRSLFSIMFMCVLYDFFFVRGAVMRTLILVMAVPIAILGNVGRIVATGVASQYNQQLIHGMAHEAFGYVSVVLAGIGCITLHLVMVSIRKAWHSRHA
ncbi:MAG: exosortase/archaeosortase family protein [Acidobacteriia bacterium]|nr:exosortase/archaeosortase family protein [Terriglobia bacterium]